MNLAQLRARLKELNGETAALTTKDAITAEDMTALETKLAEIEEIEKKIGIFEKAEAAQARAAKPATSSSARVFASTEPRATAAWPRRWRCRRATAFPNRAIWAGPRRRPLP